MIEQIALRDYQLQAIDGLRDGFRAGHRSQLLYLSTGGGKSIVAAHLMREAKRKSTRSVFLVDRTALVDQFSAHLDRFGIDHGVQMANHWRRRSGEQIQVASAQTIEKRGFFTDTDLLVVDECHVIRAATAAFIKNFPKVRVVGLSASPFTKGLSELYTNVVSVRTTNELIDEGSLVPLKVYAATSIDMTGAKVIAGEWAESEIEKRGSVIIGDVVSEWTDKVHKHFGYPAKTMVFSATVAHGDELCRQFQAAGYNFQQVSYKDGNGEDRRALLEEFKRPNSSIVGLVSVDALGRGFDCPDVLVGVSCRPFRKSFSSFIQQVGRVMRPHPGKDFALWMDHSNNWLRFNDDLQDLFANGVQNLDDNERDTKTRQEPDEKTKSELKCAACGFVLPGGVLACPACGAERRLRQSILESLPGTMVEIDGVRRDPRKPGAIPAWMGDRDSVWRQLMGMGLVRKKGDVEAATKFATGHFKGLYDEWPRATFDPNQAVQPSEELRRKVMSRIIAYAKAQGPRRAA